MSSDIADIKRKIFRREVQFYHCRYYSVIKEAQFHSVYWPLGGFETITNASLRVSTRNQFRFYFTTNDTSDYRTRLNEI